MNRDELASILKENPDIGIDVSTSVISGDIDLAGSEPEINFYTEWKRLGGCDLEHNSVEPIPGRKYRLDFADIETKIGIEIQGGADYTKGHALGHNYRRDCEKVNLSQINGWQVYLFTPQMIRENTEMIEALILHMERLKHDKAG